MDWCCCYSITATAASIQFLRVNLGHLVAPRVRLHIDDAKCIVVIAICVCVCVCLSVRNTINTLDVA